MRILNILSGIAVLFTTLAFGHLLHHHFLNASHEDIHSPRFFGGHGHRRGRGDLVLYRRLFTPEA
jgi:hypothetical protein